MSKVLKFIVHLVVICTLVCVLGLVLPPFFGVRTVIVDKADEATNLPVGSVTYAIPEKSSAISVGTPILVQKDSKTYKYTITDLDTSKGTGTVTDQSVSGGKTLTIKVGDYVPKVVVYDLARDDMSQALSDAFRYSKLVLATTTYNAGIYPFPRTALSQLITGCLNTVQCSPSLHSHHHRWQTV